MAWLAPLILECELFPSFITGLKEHMLIVCVVPEMIIHYVKLSLLLKFTRKARSHSSKSRGNATTQV